MRLHRLTILSGRRTDERPANPGAWNGHPIGRYMSLLGKIRNSAGEIVSPAIVHKQFLLSELMGVTDPDDLGMYFGDLPSSITQRHEQLSEYFWLRLSVPTRVLNPAQFLDQDRVARYMNMLDTNPPPIIVTFDSDSKSFRIQDGTHRVQCALNRLPPTRVRSFLPFDFMDSYVGISKSDIKDWLIAGDPVTYIDERIQKSMTELLENCERILKSKPTDKKAAQNSELVAVAKRTLGFQEATPSVLHNTSRLQQRLLGASGITTMWLTREPVSERYNRTFVDEKTMPFAALLESIVEGADISEKKFLHEFSTLLKKLDRDVRADKRTWAKRVKSEDLKVLLTSAAERVYRLEERFSHVPGNISLMIHERDQEAV